MESLRCLFFPRYWFLPLFFLHFLQFKRSQFWGIANALWIAALAIFGLHQFVQHVLEIRQPVIDAYLDPFLSMPILMGLMLQERRIAISVFLKDRDNKAYKFSGLQIAIIGSALAIGFEELLPRFFVGYTHDYRDYFAYALGVASFYVCTTDAAERDAAERDAAVT